MVDWAGIKTYQGTRGARIMGYQAVTTNDNSMTRIISGKQAEKLFIKSNNLRIVDEGTNHVVIPSCK